MKKKITVAAVLLLAVLLVCAGCADSSVWLSGNYYPSDGSDYFCFNGREDRVFYHYTRAPHTWSGGTVRYSVSGFTVTVNSDPVVELTLSEDGNTLTDPKGRVFTKQ